MANWEEDFNWWGEGEQPAPKTEKSSPLDTVRPFERPQEATSRDKVVAVDELGNNVYETITGKRYTIRPATEGESKTTRAKVEEWVDKGAPLPSWDQIVDTMKAIPGAMYDSAARAVRGEGTVGDALAIVPTSGAAGMATRIGQEFDPNVLSAMGATHRVPSYKPVDEFAQKGLLYDEYGNVLERIEFSNPLKEIISEMEVPNNGLKGSQLIKELQDNPTIRNSQLRSEDWLGGIDPQKRYTKEEIQGLMEGKGWSAYAAPANKYDSYQRQYNLVDQQVQYPDGRSKYVEYAIQAAPNYNQRAFRANSQHYTDDTVAHVRLSERAHGNESYVLVEELQSDLLQQGFQKPSRNWEEAKANYLKSVSDPTRFHIYNRLKKDDLLEYGTLITEHVNGLLTDSEYVEEVEKLLSKLQQRLGMENDKFARGDIYDVLMEADEVIPPNYSNITEPPVAKTEETVKLGLQTAMAHAYNSGLTKVVIPPFDEIVAKRFERGSAQFAQAMDPKSGFYATYVNGVQKALRGFQDEFGDKIRITNREMEYDPNKSEYDFDDTVIQGDGIIDFEETPTFVPNNPQELFFAERFRETFADEVERLNVGVSRVFGRNAFAKVDEIGEKVLNRNGRLISEVLDEQEELFFRAFKNAIWDTYPDVNLMSAFQEMADNQVSLSEAIFKQAGPKPKPKPQTEIKQGIEIDFSGLVEDKLDLSKPKFAEGGMVENIDPISGNEVPPGAKPEEVRDDVPIMASEGEYVIPANVVRYIGLDRIEKMVKQAKKGLEELDAEGRIGGEKATMDEDLPFSPEELMAVEEAPSPAPAMMAEGGVVEKEKSALDYYLGPTGIPDRLRALGSVVETLSPVHATRRSMEAAGRGDYAESALEGLSVIPTGRLLSGLFKTAPIADDGAKAFVETFSGGFTKQPEVLEYNAKVRTPKGILDRDTVSKTDNIAYRPERAYRFIGSKGFEDFVESGQIRPKPNSKQGYDVPYFMKGHSSSRYGQGESGDYLVEAIPSPTSWRGAAQSFEGDKYVGPKNSLTKDDPIRIFKRKEDGSYEVVFDNIKDEALLPPPVKGYAEGGMVANSEMDIDPATGLPRWLLSMQRQNTPQQTISPVAETLPVSPQAIQQTSSSDRSDPIKPVGLARPVNEWGVDDYNKYAKFRSSPEAAITQAATALIPFGGIASSFAKRATERNVTRNLSEMLKSGKDLNGNPLSTEQLASLKETYNTVTGQPIGRAGGFAGAVQTTANLISPRQPTEKRVERNRERIEGDNFINRAIDFVSGNRKPSPQSPTNTPSEQGGSSSIIGSRGESSRDKTTPERNRTSEKRNEKASVSFSKDKSTSSGDKKSSGGKKK